MSAAGSYDSRNMTMPRSVPPPPDRRAGVPLRDLPEAVPAALGDDTADATSQADGVDLSSLSVAGITRRRVAWVTGAPLSAWIGIGFAPHARHAARPPPRGD